MSLGNDTLGCDPVYEFSVTSSCSSTPVLVIPNVISYKYNRVLDKISDGKVSFAANTECEKLMNYVVEGRDHLLIRRNGCVEWSGPIRRTEFTDGQINFYGSDPLWWTKRRVSPPFWAAPKGVTGGADTGVSYASPKDLFVARILDLFSQSTIDWAAANNLQGTDYGSIVEQCDAAFPAFCFDNIVVDDSALPDGPIKILTTENPSHRTVYKVLQELAGSIIDYTVVGKDLLFGYPSTPLPEDRRQPIPYLGNDAWVEPPRVVRDISSFASDVFINTRVKDIPTTIDGINLYENGAVRVTDCSFVGHGLHQRILNRSSITGIEEAAAAGRLYLDDNADGSSVSYIENSRATQLSADVAWDLPRMVPGQVVKTDINKFGLVVSENMRLHEVVVSGSPDRGESVKVSLEPVGV